MTFLEWLKQSWVILIAVIGGISVIWTFYSRTVKEIKSEIKKPFDNLDNKIDNLQTKLDSTIRDGQLVKDSLLSMQRQSILNECEKCIRKGEASIERKQTIFKQFESYKSLGGNSFVQDMVETVMNLPLPNASVNTKLVE